MHLGIGPIVTASIIMQLFAGAKIINLTSGRRGQERVPGTQKFLVILMIFVEAVPQVFGFLTPATGFVSALNGSFLFGVISSGHGTFLAQILIVVQLFAGSYLVFLMDEVVSKWGIGSGISLFIAGGVPANLTGTFNWEPSQAGGGAGRHDPEDGLLPAALFREPTRGRWDRTDHGPAAEPADRADRHGRDLPDRRICRVDPHRAAPRPWHGPGRSWPLSDSPHVRVEHPVILWRRSWRT